MVVDAGFSVKEEMSELSEKEVQTPPESSAGETAETEAAVKEAEGIKSLDNDEGFQKSLKDMEKEMAGKLSFGQSKRFRETYWKAKENERKATEYEQKLKEYEAKSKEVPEGEEEIDEDIDDDILSKIAQERGYTLTKAEQKEVTKVETELSKLLATAQTPQEREWLENYTNAVKREVIADMGKHLGPILGPVQEMVLEYRLDKSEKAARKLIDSINTKHGTKLDYDKDIDPELAKMVKSNRNITPQNVDIVQLTQRYLAENGISLGKKISEQELKKLNETKKAAQIESESAGSGGGDEEFRGIKEHLKSQFDREGLSLFR